MILHKVEFEETRRFSPLFLDYIKKKPALSNHYNQYPEIEHFAKIIAERNFDDSLRPSIVTELSNQYEGCAISRPVKENIEALSSNNTFTITTGHQLNILTGPMFFVYKIIAAINLAGELKSRYPEFNFVPVYWMASEDHDFEEINHFRLFGREYKWEKNASGAVGRLETGSMKALLDQLPDLPEIFVQAYLESANLSRATRMLVNHLFGEQGLLILDADCPAWKQEFSGIMIDDVRSHAANDLVEKTTHSLEKIGYKGQIFSREINLFYMDDNTRERIAAEAGQFRVLNTDLHFSPEDMEALIRHSPEKFSPNVVLRPVYQETILPNIAYVGGPAEIAYWLQLKAVFDHYKVPFPVLVPRLFGMIIPKNISKKMDKNQLSVPDLFCNLKELKENLIRNSEGETLELEDELKMLEKLFNAIREKAACTDPTLEGFVISEYKKAEKSVEHIEKRIKRAEEQKHEVAINQVMGILDKLFPEGNLQERTDNILNFFINDSEIILKLSEALDPLDFRFNVLLQDE